MKRTRLLTVPLALLATLALALPAHAAEPINVDVLGCVIFQEGKTLVDRNTDIHLKFYWGSKTRRQGLRFLEAVRPTAKIDGVTIAHPNQYWSVPVQLEKDLWRTDWTYPAGQLSAGESFTVRFQLKLRERVWDGFVFYEPGKIFDSPLVCKVKAR